MNPDLKKRITTAVVLIGIMTLCVVLAVAFSWGWLALAILFLAAVSVAGFEFARICRKGQEKFRPSVYLFLTILPCLGVFCRACVSESFNLHDGLLVASVSFFVVMILSFLLLVVAGNNVLNDSSDVAKDIFVGVFLVGLGGAALEVLAISQYSALIWLILVACSNDVAAYFTGKKFGGPKMAPVISPKKTISGSIGGFLAGALIGFLASPLLPDSISFSLEVIWMSLVIVAVSQLGDLSKSYVKRLHDVKDSGKILPGHGGILDRIDAILMSAPVLCLWLFLS